MDRNEKGDFLKNMHFCTEELLKQLKEGKPGNIIETYRTGWTPGIYPGDIINLNESAPGKKNKFICKGKILYVFPLQYKEFKESPSVYGNGVEEVKRYKRKFHPDHWFFNITIELMDHI